MAGRLPSFSCVRYRYLCLACICNLDLSLVSLFSLYLYHGPVYWYRIGCGRPIPAAHYTVTYNYNNATTLQAPAHNIQVYREFHSQV